MKSISIKKAQSGFTLIEIAIVLVIIGLLLGGVLQGQQLIENSRVRAAANEFNAISTAAVAYQDRYNRLPGDDGVLATLEARGAAWPPITTAATAAGMNGVIGGAYGTTFAPAAETLGFWQHLRAAGFITGDPAAIGAAAAPTNPFGGLTGVNGLDVYGMPAGPTKVCMNNVPGTAARALDVRLDDGSRDSGSFRAELIAGGAAPSATVPNAPEYVEESVYIVCRRL